MARFLRSVALTLVLTTLSACGQATLIEPRKHEINGTLSVETPIAWNKLARQEWPLWTLDGPSLQNLTIISGLNDGSPAFTRLRRRADLPAYRSSFTPLDVKEFLATTLSRAGLRDFREEDVSLAGLGGEPAVRVDFTYASQDGLEYKGFYVAAQKGGKLFAVIYRGVRLVYFDRGAMAAEEIVKSFTFAEES